MIKVYQIQLTDEEIASANRGDGAYTHPKIKAYFDRSFDRTFNAENFQYYTHVANVQVDSMDAAFRAMNLWEEDENFFKIDRVVDVRCSSMSVGDILELENGQRYRVASFGFDLI